MSDRKALIKLAASLPKGSEERRVLLSELQKITAGRGDPPPHLADQVDIRAFSKSVHQVLAKHPRVKEGLSDLYLAEWQEWRGRWSLEVPFKTGRSFDDTFVGDPGREIMRGMENVGRRYGLVYKGWHPVEKGWGDFRWEAKPGKTAEGSEDRRVLLGELQKSATSYIFYAVAKGNRIVFQVAANMGQSNFADNVESEGYRLSKGVHKVMKEVLNPPYDYAEVNPKLAGIAAIGNTLYGGIWGDFAISDVAMGETDAVENTVKAFASLGWSQVRKRIGDWD